MAFIEAKEFAYGNQREKVMYYIVIVLIFLLSFLFLFPIYWMFKGALQPTAMAIQVPPTFLPVNLTLDNFAKLFGNFPSLRWLYNSAVVAGSATVLTLLFGSLAGYAFAKHEFPGREILFWMLLTAMMLPKQVMLVPLYVLMRNYNLYNTHAGMFLPQVAWPFGLFLMRQFMQSIPNELIQSAKVDGATEFRIFLSIIVPLSIPAFGTVGILYFTRTWNDYMWQLIMVKEPIMNTLPVAISKVARGEWSVDYGLMMAGAAYGAIPMITIFLFFQKYFVKGLTVGAVKG